MSETVTQNFESLSGDAQENIYERFSSLLGLAKEDKPETGWASMYNYKDETVEMEKRTAGMKFYHHEDNSIAVDAAMTKYTQGIGLDARIRDNHWKKVWPTWDVSRYYVQNFDQTTCSRALGTMGVPTRLIPSCIRSLRRQSISPEHATSLRETFAVLEEKAGLAKSIDGLEEQLRDVDIDSRYSAMNAMAQLLHNLDVKYTTKSDDHASDANSDNSFSSSEGCMSGGHRFKIRAEAEKHPGQTASFASPEKKTEIESWVSQQPSHVTEMDEGQ